MSSTSQRTSSGLLAPLRTEARTLARILGVALLTVGVIAAAVGLSTAAQVRHVLAYPFPRGRLGWTGMRVVLLDNGRLALAPLAAAYLLDQVRPSERDQWAGWRRHVRSLCDATLCIAVCVNLFVAGASYGAYGLKMVRYTLPYAPLELLGFACPLALYLEARPRTPARSRVLALGCAAAVLLTAAALIESLLPSL